MNFFQFWKKNHHKEAPLQVSKHIKYSNDDEYQGEIENEKRHGKGTYKFSNGNRYEGEWNNHMKHGFGKFYYYNGELYIGEWVANKKQGEGSYFYTNGDRYVGQWSMNEKNGKGTLYFNDGSIFTGHFSRNKRHGSGFLFDSRDKLCYAQIYSHDLLVENSQLKETPKELKNLIFLKKKEKNKQNLSNEIKTPVTPPKEIASSRQLKESENEDKKQSVERPSTAINEVIQPQSIGYETLQLMEHMDQTTEIKNLQEWSIEEVVAWLKKQQLQQYEQIFRENQITGGALLQLTDQDLKLDLGISILGHRKLIQSQIELYKSYYTKLMTKKIQEQKNDFQSDSNIKMLCSGGVFNSMDQQRFYKLFNYMEKIDDQREDSSKIQMKNEPTSLSNAKLGSSDSPTRGGENLNSQSDNESKMKQRHKKKKQKRESESSSSCSSNCSEKKKVKRKKTQDSQLEEDKLKRKNSQDDELVKLVKKKSKKQKKNGRKGNQELHNNSEEEQKRESNQTSPMKCQPQGNQGGSVMSRNVSNENINLEISKQGSQIIDVTTFNYEENMMVLKQSSTNQQTTLDLSQQISAQQIQLAIQDSKTSELINEQQNSEVIQPIQNLKEQEPNKTPITDNLQEDSSSESDISDSISSSGNDSDDQKNKSKHQEKKEIVKISRNQKNRMKQFNMTTFFNLLQEFGINERVLIKYQELTKEAKIGEGAYGEVFLGKWLGQNVAIKSYGKRRTSGKLRYKMQMADFLKEVEVISNLRHPNIVLYMGVCLKKLTYYLITEYLEQGSLFDHLHKKQTKFMDDRIIQIVEDISLGMNYLHGRKVLHCDLKSSNVLVDQNWNVKLCDFGLSRMKKKMDEKKQGKRIGTPHWMAPEIMRGEPYKEEADVYSFGMILWELLTGKIPYEGLSQTQIIGSVGYGDDQVELPSNVKMCLNKEPSKRPTFKQIVKFIQKGKKEQEKEKRQTIKQFLDFFE